MSSTLCSKVYFKNLCDLFEALAKLKGPERQRELQKFTQQCRNIARGIKAVEPNADTSLFPIYRLILPTLGERKPYNLQTKALGQLYGRVFCLSKSATKKLTSNKLENKDGRTGDLGDTIYWEMRLRQPNYSDITVQNVNKFLDDVAASQELNQQKDELFNHFIRKITATELKWLTRIILKDLRLSLHQKKVFEVIHPKAEERFNKSSSLRLVCEHYPFYSNDEGIEMPIEIETFSYIKPMLLEKLKIEHTGKLFTEDGQKYYVQEKFDGERSQIHMRDGRFKYFTRQGHDNTMKPMYGEFAHTGGFLTPNIARLLNRDCVSIILDGEMMLWHKKNRKFGSKALDSDVKNLTTRSQYQPCFVAYDILMYNGVSLIDKPYWERLDRLKIAFTEEEGILIFGRTDLVSNVDQLRKYFNVALEKNDEGIVVKKRDCLYSPNVRERSGCYKIKAEYSDKLVHDLDLIILGGYYGHAEWSGIVNSFLVGIAGEPTNRNGTPHEFFAVSSVGSGLSNDDIKSLQQRFKPLWKINKPAGVFGPTKGPPDVWITPKQSVILELRASEIVRTQNYPRGYSLRFPRVLKVRSDKNWYDACSETEFFKLVEDRGIVQKLTKRKVRNDDIEDVSDEEILKIRKTKMSPQKVRGAFNRGDDDDVTRVSRLFQGKEFVVINGNEEIDRDSIVKILREHMAKIVPNPSKDTFCIIVGDPHPLRANNLISKNKYDVAKVDWLMRATNLKNLAKIQEFYPWELYSTCPSTQARLDMIYDKFWDSYVDDIDEESLQRVVDKVEEYLETNDEILNQDKQKLDRLLFEDGISPYSIFRGMYGYFHNEKDLEKYSFTFMSGRVIDEFNTDVDYVFVDDSISEDDWKKYKNQINDKSTRVVSNKWIHDSFKNQRLLPIDEYVM